MIVNKVKKAKKLKEQGSSNSVIEDAVDIPRASVPWLIELYDEMNSVQVLDDKNGEYVRIKKKRYMLKSLKLQHKMADIRSEYLKQLHVLKNKRKKIRSFLDRAEQIKDLKQELFQKQKMLDVTSSNLQHAEDGYEYLKKDYFFNKIIYFTYGMAFVMAIVLILSKTVLNISIV